MTKGDLMKLVLTKEQQGYCDSAIPKELWSTCDTSLCVYDCRNNELINLAELLVTRVISLTHSTVVNLASLVGGAEGNGHSS